MRVSKADQAFVEAFEANRVPVSEFNHRGHLRLAYVYNAQMDAPAATAAMRCALLAYIAANGVPPAKFHETMTAAWSAAVRYIMGQVGPVADFDAFVAADARLLDAQVMFTHYRRDTLLSDAARTGLVPPDLEPIPPAALL